MHSIQQYWFQMISYFRFNEEDIAEIIKAAPDESESLEPQQFDANSGNVEAEEAIFNTQVKELLPLARELILQRRDISWIVKNDICRFYYAPELPKDICVQLTDLFPKSLGMSAVGVKALAIAWHEYAPRPVESMELKKLSEV